MSDLSTSLTALANKPPEELDFTPIHKALEANLTLALALHDQALQTRLDSLDTSLAQCFESQLLSSDNLKAIIRDVRDECTESVRSLQEEVSGIKQIVSQGSLRRANNTFQYSITGGDLERDDEEELKEQEVVPLITEEELAPQVLQVEVPPQTTQEVTMNLSEEEETKDESGYDLVLAAQVVPKVPQIQVTREEERDEEAKEEVKVEEIQFDVTAETLVEEKKIEEEAKVAQSQQEIEV